MTDPRRPDDARLSTADLAAASNREPEREVQTDRDVTRQAQHAHAGVIADAAARSAAVDEDRSTPLFAGNESDDFRHRWTDIQAGFVDEPRKAVENADALVASAIKRLAEIFAQERSTLESQWAQGNDVSTEDLRVALRRYRSFFDRLLSV
jgi:hypothetical protein